MKNTFLLVVLMHLVGFAQGQDYHTTKNSACFGVNRTFFGSGDITGTGINAEYAYSFNNYFAVAPRVMSAYANNLSDNSFHHASSFVTSVSLKITPMPNNFRRLKLDFGGLYHHFVKSWGQVGETNPSGVYQSNSAEYFKQDLFGLIGSLSLNIIDKQRIEGGLRMDMLTSFTNGYLNCDSWQTGVYIGLKF